MAKGFVNSGNKISKELTKAKYGQKVYIENTYKNWYNDYINSSAQFQMTYMEYKKLRRNKKKFEKWLNS